MSTKSWSARWAPRTRNPSPDIYKIHWSLSPQEVWNWSSRQPMIPIITAGLPILLYLVQTVWSQMPWPKSWFFMLFCAFSRWEPLLFGCLNPKKAGPSLCGIRPGLPVFFCSRQLPIHPLARMGSGRHLLSHWRCVIFCNAVLYGFADNPAVQRDSDD